MVNDETSVQAQETATASTVATNWRIHSGINQGDTSLTTELNLALLLQNYSIENIDFATVWGQTYATEEDEGASRSTENSIILVNEMEIN